MLELAWENMIHWRFDETREALQRVERLADADPADTESKSLTEKQFSVDSFATKLAHRKAMLSVFSDDTANSLAATKAWLEDFGHQENFMGSSIRVAQMMCLRETFTLDLTQAKEETLRAQFINANAIYGTVFLDSVVGSIYFMRGDLLLAERAYVNARLSAIRIHGERSALAAMPTAQLACLLYERNQIEKSELLLAESDGFPTEFGLVDSVVTYCLTNFRIARMRGDNHRASYFLDLADDIAERKKFSRLHAHVLAERIPLLIQNGLIKEAEALLEHPRYREFRQSLTPTPGVDSRAELMTLAWAQVAYAQGDRMQAISALKRWLQWTKARSCIRSSIRLSLQLACMYQMNGESIGARKALAEALRLGESGGFIRSFADAGPVVFEILDDLTSSSIEGQFSSSAYIRQIQNSRDQVGSPSPPIALVPQNIGDDPRALSEREVEILRLAAQSLVSSEIAATLGLAESTVKWYWKRIFEKLGVRKRAGAIRVARQRGIRV